MIRDALTLLFMVATAFAGGALIAYQVGFSRGWRRGTRAVMEALEVADPGVEP